MNTANKLKFTRIVHFNEQCREEKQPRAVLILPAF